MIHLHCGTGCWPTLIEDSESEAWTFVLGRLVPSCTGCDHTDNKHSSTRVTVT